ncbi:hypothetical protein GJ744_005061 [Endocarpon pusillum]|uniref:Uncharacterized protein n=1 Tax=Endocarpon pusillum TaxID=364733 RepID=A0A8H7E5G2_9EURO|nr:hypothetical protein GJ744_005061 [Endocarpon pusillum]
MDHSNSSPQLTARKIYKTQSLNPDLKSWTYHYNLTLSPPAHTGPTQFPVKRRWLYRRSFRRLIGVNQTTNP